MRCTLATAIIEMDKTQIFPTLSVFEAMQKAVIERLEDATEERLFDLRFELGKYYLETIMCLPPSQVQRYLRDNVFWFWWVQQHFYINDKRFIYYINRNKLNRVTCLFYLVFMKDQMHRLPLINKYILDTAQREMQVA